MSEPEILNKPKNHLLAALPDEDYQRLLPHLEEVQLPLRKILYEPGETLSAVYFPNNAMVSLVATMEDGATVEVGLVGAEGVIGLPIVLGGKATVYQAIVQLPGTGTRLDADIFKAEFERGEYLQRLVLLYTQALLTQVSQNAVCNRLHTIDERLGRWLLSVQDSLEADELPLTQEFISQMLGTRRASVTVAAGSLQEQGIISYSRGKITILNRERLREKSCECYNVISGEFNRLLGLKRNSS
ncbi:Crp/Fnr family transcriptional regulator [Cyanobacteria bacterium FACHB-471]|nr:Crp/Fnr family transcriptional regulator [Cyanobacteria bacterium FACHB-471]